MTVQLQSARCDLTLSFDWTRDTPGYTSRFDWQRQARLIADGDDRVRNVAPL